MPVKPPSRAELQAIAQSFSLHLDDSQMATMESLVGGALASYDVVDALADEDRQTAPDRPSSTPAAADNPLNGWYVTCDVTGSATGPLAGKRVAVKDNIMVAGRADDERLACARGLRAGGGRDGRDPAARGRWHGRRQGRVRGPLLLGRQPHQCQRPGPQPLGHQPLDRRLELRLRRAGRLGRRGHGDRG